MSFLSVLGLIVVATERLTEMVKNIWDAGAHMGKWQYRLYVHSWAAVIGTFLSFWVRINEPAVFPPMFNSGFGCFLIGLICCGGAGIWNSSVVVTETVSEELTSLLKKIRQQ